MPVVENLAPNNHADLHQDDVDANSHHNSHHNHHHIDLHQDDVDARDREPRVQWADEEEEVVRAGMGPAHGGESRRPGTFIIIVGIESCIGIGILPISMIYNILH